MADYASPIGTGGSLTPERVDMGVDYGGKGPLYALGSGTITNVTNSGWPNSTFLALHLDQGQYAGRYVYYAEDLTPSVSVGQHVSTGQQIAQATGGSSGIELGWASPPGTGNALGASQFSGNNATAYGVSYSNLIASLGGKPGIVSGPVSGTVPSVFPSSSSTATGADTTAATTGVSLFDPSTWATGIIGAVSSSFGSDIKDWLERGGLILLGFALVIMGIHMLAGGGNNPVSSSVNNAPNKKETTGKETTSTVRRKTETRTLERGAVEAAAVA